MMLFTRLAELPWMVTSSCQPDLGRAGTLSVDSVLPPML